MRSLVSFSNASELRGVGVTISFLDGGGDEAASVNSATSVGAAPATAIVAAGAALGARSPSTDVPLMIEELWRSDPKVRWPCVQ